MAEQEPVLVGEEFEREPVPRRALLGFKSFIGMYAGEHCAGTELMIGPLFVAAGVSAFDVVVGLLLGNLLAVLSWVVLCAPIAVRARLTLYYQLEKICGRSLVTLYNLANGVMFCFLAGAMITVSATAVGVWFEFPMPALTDIYPNSVGWVLAVLVVGMLISIVAAFGYTAVAKFANIAAPWMVLLFLAFGFVGFGKFVRATGTEINSLSDVWTLCETSIWTGGDPLPGQLKFTFWHVTFFAWFCNMAMHVGMSDLSVLRFAKKAWYGSASASGMYVGHFMAWLAASMLFAYQLHETHPDNYMAALLAEAAVQGERNAESFAEISLTPELIGQAMETESQLKAGGQLDAFKDRLIAAGAIDSRAVSVSVPTPLPGPLAANACGLAGLLCVIVAGWTTANPTIYRAGLAFQAIMPTVSRFKVTLATGMLATLAGLFPGIAMRLLGFVALYGLVLMPMGAVIFVDFWLFKKRRLFGLLDDFAERRGLNFNWAAAVAWIATLVVCLTLVMINPVVYGYRPFQIYFVSLPGWFLAAILYIAVSAIVQRQLYLNPSFRLVAQVVSWISLAGAIVPAALYLTGSISLEDAKRIMIVSTVCWFIATPLWMGMLDKRSGATTDEA